MTRTKRNEGVLHGPGLRSKAILSVVDLDALSESLAPGVIVKGQLHVDGTPSHQAALVRVKEIWFEAPISDQWCVAYRISTARARPVIAELRLFPAEPMLPSQTPGVWSGEWAGHQCVAPGDGINSKLMQQIKLGEHRNQIFKCLQNLAQHFPNPQSRNTFFRDKLNLSGIPRTSRRGPARRVTPLDLVIVVQAYLDAHQGGSRAPTRDAAQRLGLSKTTLKKRIARARSNEETILSKTTRGNPGGELTAHGKELLKRTQQSRRS